VKPSVAVRHRKREENGGSEEQCAGVEKRVPAGGPEPRERQSRRKKGREGAEVQRW